jgi:hypothetical protein
MVDLSQVTIGIKTFLRDEKLFRTLAGIRRTMPDVRISIADDGGCPKEKGDLYIDMQRAGHTVNFMEFDSGFGAKSNLIAYELKTPYLLVASDDFDFEPPSARAGVERMVEAMQRYASLDIVSGRVDGNPYEFYLTERQPGQWYERPLRGYEYFNEIATCDLTVNYSLIRREVFWKGGVRTNIGWDHDVKIGGGEHGAFFIDAKKGGLKVAYVPGVNISQFKELDNDVYSRYRGRARNSERPCFQKRGITKYVGGDGTVDYEAK